MAGFNRGGSKTGRGRSLCGSNAGAGCALGGEVVVGAAVAAVGMATTTLVASSVSDNIPRRSQDERRRRPENHWPVVRA